MKQEEIETYIAVADAEVAMALAATESPFKIEVRFLEGLTQAQQDAFKTAADRWTRIIVGDLPAVMVNGEVIDDLLIFAQGSNIDGPGQILGQAGPIVHRINEPRRVRRALISRSKASHVSPFHGRRILRVSDVVMIHGDSTNSEWNQGNIASVIIYLCALHCFKI